MAVGFDRISPGEGAKATGGVAGTDGLGFFAPLSSSKGMKPLVRAASAARYVSSVRWRRGEAFCPLSDKTNGKTGDIPTLEGGHIACFPICARSGAGDDLSGRGNGFALGAAVNYLASCSGECRLVGPEGLHILVKKNRAKRNRGGGDADRKEGAAPKSVQRPLGMRGKGAYSPRKEAA